MSREDTDDERRAARRAATALREAEQELREREIWLRVLLRAFPGVVWTADRDLRITALAGARVEQLGLDPSDVIGHEVAAFLPGPLDSTDSSAEVHAPTLQELHLVALHGEPSTYEFVHRDRAYEVRIEPLVPEEREGVIALALDVTERRRLEEERMERRLQQSQKLESLGLLAGGIAHDFNNLLVGMLGHATLAMAENHIAPPLREHLERIESAAQRAADLTRQLLAYSGQGRFVVETIALSELVYDMAQLLQITISRRAELQFDFAKELPSIDADAAQVRQVVMNLITNASSALGEAPGTIRLATSEVSLDPEDLPGIEVSAGTLEPDHYVVLEVSDTGRGMDAAVRERMFDPFFTTRDDGHGLGLAAVLGIVRGHGGAIQVESEPGNGTTIRLWFPASERSTNRGLPTLEAFDVGHGGCVLVVDDERAVRTLARAALERAGYEVECAVGGLEALKAFESAPDRFGLVLLDLTMPELDGEQTFRTLRRIRPGVRVLLSSGYTEQEATSQFAGRGLAGFLQKPYRAAELVARVDELMSAAGPQDVESDTPRVTPAVSEPTGPHRK